MAHPVQLSLFDPPPFPVSDGNDSIDLKIPILWRLHPQAIAYKDILFRQNGENSWGLARTTAHEAPAHVPRRSAETHQSALPLGGDCGIKLRGNDPE